MAYVKISQDDAKKMMNENTIILDVRELDEYEELHIKNAVHLPLGEIGERAAEVLFEKTQTILTYCFSGRRSEMAAKELIKLGYSSVYDFGGIEDWTGETEGNEGG